MMTVFGLKNKNINQNEVISDINWVIVIGDMNIYCSTNL